MRALTVDCVTFILRAASMKLPVSATIRKVRARAMSIALSSGESIEDVSIENVDRRQRKKKIGNARENFQIDRARTRFGRVMEGYHDEGEEGKEGEEEGREEEEE